MLASAGSTSGFLSSSQSLLNSMGQLVNGKMQAVLSGVTSELRSWGTTVIDLLPCGGVHAELV